VRSQNRTVTVLRCSREGAAVAASVPHCGQNLNAPSDLKPQFAQAGTRPV